MLSVGAKSTQFTLLNVTFQPNYNKDPNALYISGGRLAHYAIEENIRQWVLTTATYTNLKPATAYYIYARCSTAAGDGTIILSESAITVEQEAGYYNFLVGVLNSVVTDAGGKNPGRLVSLTYGSSTINGRFLRTGRIESSGGGKCYFDLDNDEIGGVIRFVGSDGNYYDIADVQDTADRKRQVFVAQPYGPYDVGDLWLRSWTDSTGVARKDLYRCVTARASGFNVNDWAEATFYDNTQVTIDRGIITAGTVQLANGNSQSIVAGITGGENEAANETEARKVRIWAGASKANRFTAPFRVLQDGSFVATKGTITGTINANSGTIGGFEIGSGRIGTASSSTASSGSGLSLFGDFIKFANTYCWASIGTNVLPASVGMVGVGRFTNSTPNSWGTNYGLLISVTGATTNLAIKATGAIVSDSYIESYGLATITPSTNTCHIPGELTSPTMFRIKAKFIYDNAGIGFPSRGSIATALGIGSSTPFAVRFTIIVDSTSTKTGYITGRNTFVTGKSSAGATTYPMNSNSYPYRLNQNGGNETGKMNMAKGDTAEFMLVWDGSSNYYAYWLSHIS